MATMMSYSRCSGDGCGSETASVLRPYRGSGRSYAKRRDQMKLRLVVNNDDPLTNSILALAEARRRLDRLGSAEGSLAALWDVCDAKQKLHKEFAAEVARRNAAT